MPPAAAAPFVSTVVPPAAAPFVSPVVPPAAAAVNPCVPLDAAVGGPDGPRVDAVLVLVGPAGPAVPLARGAFGTFGGDHLAVAATVFVFRAYYTYTSRFLFLQKFDPP